MDFRPQRYLAPYPSQNKTALCHKHVPLVNHPSLLFLNGPSKKSVACTCLVVGQMCTTDDFKAALDCALDETRACTAGPLEVIL